jgi:hypothetical protein
MTSRDHESLATIFFLRPRPPLCLARAGKYGPRSVHLQYRRFVMSSFGGVPVGIVRWLFVVIAIAEMNNRRMTNGTRTG